MRKYAVIYEQADDGSWSARAAELPVYAVGDSREEAETMIAEAIRVHLDYLEEIGEEIDDTGDIDVGIVAA